MTELVTDQPLPAVHLAQEKRKRHPQVQDTLRNSGMAGSDLCCVCHRS